MNKEAYTIVTGAGGSIGQAITRALAEAGENVIMACRNLVKDTPQCKKINSECPGKVEIVELNLASFDNIASFTSHIRSNYPIKALINNAGVINKHYETTAQGYEMTIGVNFMGTYLLTMLLAPALNNGHITFTTSLTRYIGKVNQNFFDLTADNYGRFKAYSRSKLATTILTAYLSKKLSSDNILVNAADPGIVDSGMIHMDAWFDPIADRCFRPFISTPEQGAVSALTANASNTSCEIFEKTHHHAIPQRIQNHPYTEWLINETERQLADRLV